MIKNTPLISVIMPVYNTATFLRPAIQSILDQSFHDFELIIIDDASTDHSGTVISEFKDERIRSYRNEKNLGLAITLNKAIRLSGGKYIARMDGDDISLPNRFEVQVAALKKEADRVVVCSTCQLIDEEGRKIGNWKDDKKYLKTDQIRKHLPFNNCIVHPSVMVTKDIITEFFYDPVQHESEDYDLWLRMSSDGIRFVKIQDALVQHRIRKESFTRKRQQNVHAKLFLVKQKFVFHEILKGRINLFVAKTLICSILDFLLGVYKHIKNIFKR